MRGLQRVRAQETLYSRPRVDVYKHVIAKELAIAVIGVGSAKAARFPRLQVSSNRGRDRFLPIATVASSFAMTQNRGTKGGRLTITRLKQG